MLFAERHQNVKDLDKKIRLKGRDQQELSYLFPSLYNGNKPVTKRTKGIYKQYQNHINSKSYIKYL